MKKIIVAAVAQNGVIGKNNKVPWHSREELRNFRKITIGYPVLMGRKTFDSLDKPLPDRLNLVISKFRDKINEDENVIVFGNIENAIKYCSDILESEKLFIIGGADIFKQTINDSDELFISYMKLSANGDIYFPAIDPEMWIEASRTDFNDFEFVVYKRKK